VDSSLCDPGLVYISGVIHTKGHIGYNMLHDDKVVCGYVQQCTTLYDGVQCFL
jgi:hypothetical protein